MTKGPERRRPDALTCPTYGGAVERTTEDGLPGFACHLEHRSAAAEMGEAQVRQTEQVLQVALRIFGERAELARRLAETQRRRGRPVSAEQWEATNRQMTEGAEVLRRFLMRNWWHSQPDGDESTKPVATKG